MPVELDANAECVAGVVVITAVRLEVSSNNTTKIPTIILEDCSSIIIHNKI